MHIHVFSVYFHITGPVGQFLFIDSLLQKVQKLSLILWTQAQLCGELKVKDKKGALINYISTGHWKEGENQEKLVQDSDHYLQTSVKYLYPRFLSVNIIGVGTKTGFSFQV